MYDPMIYDIHHHINVVDYHIIHDVHHHIICDVHHHIIYVVYHHKYVLLLSSYPHRFVHHGSILS